MAKKTKKVRKQKAAVVDVKKAAANDKETRIEVKRVPKSGSAVAKGAAYSVLAGRPSRQVVTAVFGKKGYALSWIARAARMNVTPENLCARFKAEPEQMKAAWASLLEKKPLAFIESLRQIRYSRRHVLSHLSGISGHARFAKGVIRQTNALLLRSRPLGRR